MLTGGLVIDHVGVRAALGGAGLLIAAVALVAGLSTGERAQVRRLPATATVRG
jgi:hypothetical protein